MIAPYIYDADVLNASFCVEFDPDEGTALGVCYSDRAKSFYYGNTQPKGGRGSADISGRSRKDRYDRLVGYYGVDSVSSTPEPMEGSVFKSLELVNKETLSLQWELEAASQVTKKSPDYDGSYSIRRLGFSAAPLYARMQASGTGYRPSQWEQTNTEHSYFSKEEAKKDGTKIYHLKNARNLFNLRFEEKDAPDDTVLYRQEGDIIWNGEKGMAAGGFLFEKTKQLLEPEQGVSFPSASKLNKKHTLQGMDENDQSYAVQSFRFGAKDQKTPAGLFEINEGTIRNMVLKRISSEGTDYVGTVCGVNYGTLKNISVDKKSTVTGKKFVGGITGVNGSVQGKISDILNQDIDLGSFIVNKEEYTSKAVLKNWTNKGIVTANELFAGGITGLNTGKIQNCTSRMQTEEKDKEKIQKLLLEYGALGIQVGGIAGYNNGLIGSKQGSAKSLKLYHIRY